MEHRIAWRRPRPMPISMCGCMWAPPRLPRTLTALFADLHARRPRGHDRHRGPLAHLVLAQRRRERAPQHRLRRVPRYRQPCVAGAPVPVYHLDLHRRSGRRCATCGATRPCSWSTWRSAWPFCSAARASSRQQLAAMGRDYLREDFHPSQHPADSAQRNGCATIRDQFTP